jgi:hypothetical protein
MKPSEVFIRQNESENVEVKSQSKLRLQSNIHSYANVDTSGLIDYVDFGPDINAFLLNIGVCDSPSASMLAELLLDRHASFLANPMRRESEKIRAYIACLERLKNYIEAAEIKKEGLISQALQGRLKNEPWCLAYHYTDKIEEAENFKIVTPKEVYRIDDRNIAIHYRPLCSPSWTLDILYERFGSPWLTECVTINYTCKGTVTYIRDISYLLEKKVIVLKDQPSLSDSLA